MAAVLQWKAVGKNSFLSSRTNLKLIGRCVTGSATDAGDIRMKGIPLVPKDRDPDAVLKALASTVDPPLREPFFMGRSESDPFAPRNRRQMWDYVMAREAGKRAGEYIIGRYPKLFPGRQPTPDLRPWRPQWKGLNEETLKELIRGRKTSKAQEVLKELMTQKNPVSLPVQNGLLALLAYTGIGNVSIQPITEPIATDEQETVDETNSVKYSTHREKEKPRRKLARLKQSWNLENEAEKMFTSMTKKDGGTYGVMIQGLAKFRNCSRAMALFEEARSNGHQLSLATYNMLLSAVLDSEETNQWKKVKTIISNMSTAPVVEPDIDTINLLLLLAQGEGAESKQTALKVMREMIYLGLEPSLTTFLRLLDCFMKQNDSTILYPIVNYLEQNPQILEIKEYSDVDFFAYAMLGARMLRDASLARRLKELSKKDQWYLVGNLETFMSHYIFVFSFEFKMEQLHEEYKDLVPHMFIPKEWVYQLLFKKCESEAKPDIALALWQDALKNRVNITDMDVINRLMGAFTKPIDLKDIDQYIAAIKDVWKKLEYLSEKPSPLILSVTIKMFILNKQLDEAWQYYDMFEQNEMKPTFLALHSLLKAYYNLYDQDKVIDILELMVNNRLFLPLNFVKNVCHNVGISKEKRTYFLKEFENNRPMDDFEHS